MQIEAWCAVLVGFHRGACPHAQVTEGRKSATNSCPAVATMFVTTAQAANGALCSGARILVYGSRRALACRLCSLGLSPPVLLHAALAHARTVSNESYQLMPSSL